MSQAVADRETLPFLLRFSSLTSGRKEPPSLTQTPTRRPSTRPARAKLPKPRRGYPEWLGYTPEIQRLLR